MRAKDVEKELARIQALFDWANRGGAMVMVAPPPPDDAPLPIGLGVEFRALRVAPRVLMRRVFSDFILRWKEERYWVTEHRVHHHTITSEVKPEERPMRLVDDREWTLILYPAPEDVWREWQGTLQACRDVARYADRIIESLSARIIGFHGAASPSP